MKAKLDVENSVPTTDVNKQMLEIKKKIQLSEGQRKAAFEDCDAERKQNIEEIHKLKKEITDLVKELKETTHVTAGIKNFDKTVEAVVGPIGDKTTDEIQELLDLQIVDKTKALNLIQYQIKKKQAHLARLGKEYQTLLSQKARKEVKKKVDKPNKKAVCDLQNSIHAVEVQFREANHVATRYKDIKTSLQKDSARFESNIQKIEEDLIEQNTDISKLQQVMDEATQKRSKARGYLQQEEKHALATANSRELQTAEGRRLVLSRKQELEMLEKRIFQAQKLQTKAVAVGDTDGHENNEEEVAETPPLPQDVLAQTFEILKQATGATSTDQVLDRFSLQKNTFDRLVLLRKTAEEDKGHLEKKLDELNAQLEFYKYAEVKESERKSTEMDQIQEQISEELQRSQKAIAIKSLKDKTISTILNAVKDLHHCVNPLSVSGNNISGILTEVKEDLKDILERAQAEDMARPVESVVIEELEEKWLPGPYSGLVRRTPLPQPGSSPAPPPQAISEDEEEVPSRTYLKRQAQMVIDAKSRRKNVRVQPPKRN